MRYILVSIVIALVTYGQLIIKRQVGQRGPAPLEDPGALGQYLLSALLDVGIVSGLGAAVLAALAWIVTVSKYELSSVYPFLAINFLLVPLLSVVLFRESINVSKVLGLSIVIVGLLIFARGA